jgi:hypothetical protein
MTWTDHTDVRPTMLALLGLEDDYTHDGRVIVEQLDPEVLPDLIQASLDDYQALATAYTQLNAPLGELLMASIKYSTALIKTEKPAVYDRYLTKMANFTARRDELVAKIKAVLDGAAFGDTPIRHAKAVSLATQAKVMVLQMQGLAAALTE